MWPATICLVAAYIRGDIKRVLKHPMLVGVKLWALAHLIANGDLGGIILFGSILAWAVFDRITLKRRSDPGAPPIPNGGRRNDVIAVVVGTLLYLALGFWFHPYVIGAAGVRELSACRRSRTSSGSPHPTSAPARAASRSCASPPTTPTRRAWSIAIAT